MDKIADRDTFFDAVPIFTQFEGVADAANYRPLPDDWALGDGRHRRLHEGDRSRPLQIREHGRRQRHLSPPQYAGRRDLPFVFGGDGALVAFPDGLRERTREALAAVQAWVADELGLTMRAAIVPMADIRANGLDVRVARFQASEEVSYAMFAGGGSSWAEAEMKAGRYGIEPAPAGTRPDLTGLSCRWNPIEARHGEIVSIIAVSSGPNNIAAFRQLVADIVALAGEEERAGHPVPRDGPDYSFPPRGLDAEVRAIAPKGHRLWPRLFILGQMALTKITDKFGWTIGRFDPKQYKRDVAENSDFRKFDDGLKMTIDVGPDDRRKDRGAPDAGRTGGGVHLWPTPAGFCADDLHRCLAHCSATTCISSTARLAVMRWRRRR